ncbi:sigma-54-dependent Fis family transcriptional regulator [Thioclava atlantica]|uniref:Fis family GAF modulated sigma54 specific transcriptional regulator n=1 Tax=Thioclava atlantica TaxID=1317124 RepID=A0A085TUY3_9RHOB|nr:helix-turn-helix domain-containing protein [Thioclava atlantica]KFE34530.1 Fis family GAF modulated sigma54 specific transcriptional regulator [Thioclava atlantica]
MEHLHGGKLGRRPPDPLVAASWRRCEDLHHLLPDVSRPVLRFQQSEIRQRAECFAEMLGDGLGQLAPLESALACGGGTLLVSDAEQVLLPLTSAAPADAAMVRRGIVAGSCWDERVAGTNGIQMALTAQAPFTVRGADHFFVALRQFSCCSVPILDAENRIVGALTSAAVDRKQGANQALAATVLQITARRLQAAMFRRRHAGDVLLSLAPLDASDLDGTVNALIALDDRGRVLAATRRAARMAGGECPDAMIGKTTETLFGIGFDGLVGAPGWFARSDGRHPAPLGLQVSLPVSARRTTGPRATVPEPASPPRDVEIPAEAEAAFGEGLPVLLIGETGTGKTTLARQLHSNLNPTGAEAVTIDCAQVEATEAGRLRLRLPVEQALQITRDSGGAATLILDHLEALAPVPQAWLVELLSLLEERPAFPDGAPTLRIVGLFARPPEDLVAAGRLRDDLLYRLQGARVVLPRLRDCPLMLENILMRLAREAAGRRVPISAAALGVLAAYPWPGNLREARHVMRLACSRAGGRPIRSRDLPSHLAAAASAPGPEAAPAEARLVQALRATGWNVSAAARMLGLSRSTLHRKIRNAGLDRPGSRPI